MITTTAPHQSLLPQPIPGKTPPPRSEALDWVGKPLVSMDAMFNHSAGASRVATSVFRGIDIGKPNSDGDWGTGKQGTDAFIKLNAGSLTAAVEAVSALASERKLHVNMTGPSDPNEKFVSPAFALLQAASGAYYVTGLHNDSANVENGQIWNASLDTSSANFTINDVKQLNPAVKAVVGAYSWVNFTNEAAQPKLAG